MKFARDCNEVLEAGKGPVMLFWFTVLFLCSPTSAKAAGYPSSAVVVDRAVALVGSTVITQTDVTLHHALTALDPSFVPILNETEANALNSAIDAAIIRHTAGRIPVYQPTETQVDNRMNRFVEQWSSNLEYQTFLDIHGLTNERLKSVLQRRATIERVVLRALGAPKADPEWNKRFDAWMQAERKGIRVRTISPQDPQ